MKKIKFKKKFVKQNLQSITILENLRVFQTIHNKGNVIGENNADELRRRIFNSMSSDIKRVENSVKLYEIYTLKLDKLKEEQKLRRVKLFNWFTKYVDKLERQEINRFMARYEGYIILPGIDATIEEEYSDEIIVFGDRITSEAQSQCEPEEVQEEENEVSDEEFEVEEDELEDEQEEIEGEEQDTDLIADEVEIEAEEDDDVSIERMINS